VLAFASGTAAIPLTVRLPANPAFLGLDLFAQAAAFDAATVRVTNAIRETVIW
jgi:hypothetical protein